ncbi:hypothetical protein CACET_c35490 [Clostridium aceticum]|uniref:Uncharacterized protein n=1 Tax=Clostridium aceticum TaxID=84022 RepID=A0A0D8I5W4_9CLOT|nr:hypothetical protein [Clostridium aceticum]AKL96980.1 hypothetical protein CACET_c35490 [Clostridium aceticum]KJF25638.1 hypothetical protein TZ02_17615 [Clostridium aceticum]
MRISKKLYYGISMLIAMTLTILLPGRAFEMTPGGMLRYEFGLPFHYITIYQYQPTSNWMIPNLFGGNAGLGVDPFPLLMNAFILYLIIDFIRPSSSLEEKRALDIELLKYLGILFLGLLLIHRLPHNSYSVMQYIIPPISFQNGGTLYLSGLPILILFIYSFVKIISLSRFAEKSKFFIFLILIVMIMPLMGQSIHLARSTYHALAQSNLAAVDCNFDNSSINITTGEDGEVLVNVSLELIDYGRNHNQFKVRIHIPEKWQAYFDMDSLQLEKIYTTDGYRNTIKIQEELQLQIAEGHTESDIWNHRWYNQTFYYELYNDEESIMIINHGR